MISSKKILSIMATMDSINYDFFQYKDITFFDNVPRILQDIFLYLNIYYIIGTGTYCFIYDCDVLEPSGKGFEKNEVTCLSNHNFESLGE